MKSLFKLSRRYSSHRKCDIGIIGAGPGGLSLSLMLAQHGISSIVIDKNSRETIYELGRAGFMDYTTRHIIDYYNLSDRINVEGYKSPSCFWRAPDYNFTWEYCKLLNQDIKYANYYYQQVELVSDMSDKCIDSPNIDLCFQHKATDIINYDTTHMHGEPTIKCHDMYNDINYDIKCKFIIAADGFYGLGLKTMMDAKETNNKDIGMYHYLYPSKCLGIYADAKPSTDKIIYCTNPQGFAGHMIRTETLCRYYLQCSLDDELEDWSDEKIWDTLDNRLSAQGFSLNHGEITDKHFFPMRAHILEKMRLNKLFVIGDAAHITTFLGAKGLCNAIQDSYVLLQQLYKYFKTDIKSIDNYKGEEILDSFSQKRIPVVWENHHLCFTFLDLLWTHGEPWKQALWNDKIFKSLKNDAGNLFEYDLASKYVAPCNNMKEYENGFMDLIPMYQRLKTIKDIELPQSQTKIKSYQ